MSALYTLPAFLVLSAWLYHVHGQVEALRDIVLIMNRRHPDYLDPDQEPDPPQ